MEADDNAILTTYYDHYKETVADSKKAQVGRNKTFVFEVFLELSQLIGL